MFLLILGSTGIGFSLVFGFFDSFGRWVLIWFSVWLGDRSFNCHSKETPSGVKRSDWVIKCFFFNYFFMNECVEILLLKSMMWAFYINDLNKFFFIYKRNRSITRMLRVEIVTLLVQWGDTGASIFELACNAVMQMWFYGLLEIILNWSLKYMVHKHWIEGLMWA